MTASIHRTGSFLRTWRVGLGLAKQRFVEFLTFDSAPARTAFSAALSLAAVALYGAGRFRTAISMAMALDRGAYAGPLPSIVRRALTDDPAVAPGWVNHVRGRVQRTCAEHVRHLSLTATTSKFFATPERLLGPLAMVVKTPCGDEKGVLLLLYSHVLPLFLRLFDLEKVCARYHLVLEPSWSGYCNPDVLCYRYVDAPIFVQAYEPRDRSFIDGLRSNLVAIPTSNNWWVDHRMFVPLPGVRKDIDVIMVAGWGNYKRHARFFQALSALRRRGVRMSVALVGYPLGFSADDLRSMASHYGIADQIAWHENLSQPEVNALLNRSKVNVLWSRKEGVNRAIIEGMFADVPCIVRAGFNYGYAYPYINDATGRYATEDELPDLLVRMVEQHDRFAPRGWVMEHMSCQESTRIVERTMTAHLREAWSDGLAVKTNGLHGMAYWSDEDGSRFADDYAFLASAIRTRPA